MLNVIWPVFIIISIIYGLIVGRMDAISNSIFESAEGAVSLTITFFGTLCLWNGIMQIANKTTLIGKLSNLLGPFMRFLFKDIKKEDKEYKEISMNIVANVMGLGNAATPLGLKAMKTMQLPKHILDTQFMEQSIQKFEELNTHGIKISEHIQSIKALLGF